MHKSSPHIRIVYHTLVNLIIYSFFYKNLDFWCILPILPPSLVNFRGSEQRKTKINIIDGVSETQLVLRNLVHLSALMLIVYKLGISCKNANFTPGLRPTRRLGTLQRHTTRPPTTEINIKILSPRL